VKHGPSQPVTERGTPIQSSQPEQLQGHPDRIASLGVKDRTVYNRRGDRWDKVLRRQTTARRARLHREVTAIDKKLAAALASSEASGELVQRLRNVPGVGPVLSAALVALLPELGTLSRRKVASLVGVAPFDNDSGNRRGERHIQGGRARLRRILYMATLSATQHNPVIAAFARRLAGKEPKVIITACMRKLLVILNAMVRDAKDWSPKAA
jgi:transposase